VFTAETQMNHQHTIVIMCIKNPISSLGQVYRLMLSKPINTAYI